MRPFILVLVAALAIAFPAAPALTAVNARDYASLQAAVDCLAGPGCVDIPAGRYVLTKPLNLRNRYGVTLRGDGFGSIIRAQFPEAGLTWPIVDMTGSNRCRLQDLRVETVNDAKYTCGCGILEARAQGESAGFHVLDNVHVGGFFRGACLWNAASECNTYISCNFTNFKNARTPTDGGWCAFFGNGNVGVEASQHPYTLVVSPYGPYGGSTMQETNLYNCLFTCYQGSYPSDPKNGQSVNVMLHCNKGATLTDFHLDGGGLSNGSTNKQDNHAGGFAAFYVAGGAYNVTIRNVRCETNGARYWLYQPTDGGSIVNLLVSDCTLQSLENTFRLELASRSGPIAIERNTIQNFAQYDWGDGERSVWDSVRDTGVRMQDNVYWSYRPADPYRFNRIYRCSQFSENATLQVPDAAAVSAPAATWGLRVDAYRMPNPSATGGLRTILNLGYPSSWAKGAD